MKISSNSNLCVGNSNVQIFYPVVIMMQIRFENICLHDMHHKHFDNIHECICV